MHEISFAPGHCAAIIRSSFQNNRKKSPRLPGDKRRESPLSSLRALTKNLALANAIDFNHTPGGMGCRLPFRAAPPVCLSNSLFGRRLDFGNRTHLKKVTFSTHSSVD